MQRYTIFFIAVNALHVSGGFYAHHQELKTVHTQHRVYVKLLPPLVVATVSLTYTRCCVYSFELLMMGGETA
jgi:hypothetical protein